MEQQSLIRKECGYHELLNRLDRANESLAFYKNNKEISVRDLQKLEMENSALAEENEYLKKRIKNAERNASLILNKSLEKLDMSHDLIASSLSFVSHKDPVCDMSVRKPVAPASVKDYENENTLSTYRKKPQNPMRASYPSSIARSSTIREFHVKDYALIRSALLYHV